MNISVGILAHNEANCIAELIEDLGRQTILNRPDMRLFIHVIANGCSDNTAEVARHSFDDRDYKLPHVVTIVHEAVESGKANAWNRFVHEFVGQNSDFVFLLDADIRLVDTSTMNDVLNTLVMNPASLVAVDEPVKDVFVKPSRNLIDAVILHFSGTATDVKTAICGQFYCARYEVMRGIYMPTGIIGEDGFLRAMILTANFTEHEDINRIVSVPGARHVFETRRNLADILHHQVRLAVGTGLNVLLFTHFRSLQLGMKELGEYIRARNENDMNWFNKIVEQEVAKGRYFVCDWKFVFRRLHVFGKLPLSRKILRFPIYVAGMGIDAIILLIANRMLKKGTVTGFW